MWHVLLFIDAPPRFHGLFVWKGRASAGTTFDLLNQPTFWAIFWPSLHHRMICGCPQEMIWGGVVVVRRRRRRRRRRRARWKRCHQLMMRVDASAESIRTFSYTDTGPSGSCGASGGPVIGSEAMRLSRAVRVLDPVATSGLAGCPINRRRLRAHLTAGKRISTQSCPVRSRVETCRCSTAL